MSELRQVRTFNSLCRRLRQKGLGRWLCLSQIGFHVEQTFKFYFLMSEVGKMEAPFQRSVVVLGNARVVCCLCRILQSFPGCGFLFGNLPENPGDNSSLLLVFSVLY